MLSEKSALKYLREALAILEQSGLRGMDANYFVQRLRTYLKRVDKRGRMR